MKLFQLDNFIFPALSLIVRKVDSFQLHTQCHMFFHLFQNIL